MKPYTFTISCQEHADVYAGLRRGLWCAQQHKAANMIGADDYIEQIEKALKVFNRPMEGGYENQAERDAAFVARMTAECEEYGCD